MSRRTELTVVYNGVDVSKDLQETIISMSYTDSVAGRIDDLSLSLEDTDGYWRDPWEPQAGDRIEVSLKVLDWDGDPRHVTLSCGSFEVDFLSINGPPSTVTLAALSLPAGVAGRLEMRSRAWEKVRFRTIAADVASRSGLSLFYDTPDNPLYDRIDQVEQTDFAFLQELCEREGLAFKVADKQLIIFDEFVYEQREPFTTITLGESDITQYSFEWSTSTSAYRACKVTYRDGKRGKDVSATYTPPGAPTSGAVLNINESVESQAEALRIARVRLREQNKSHGRGSISLMGDVRIAAGMTITVSGFGKFDGKYIIDQATHSTGADGYKTDIEIRRVLGW